MKQNADTDSAINEVQVALRLGVSASVVRAWRYRNRGPRFIKLGRAVRYLPEDVDQFIAANAVGSSAAQAARRK